MTRQDISEQLREIVRPFVQDEEALAQLSEDTHLVNDLAINSTDVVDIILDVEDRFRIEIDDEDAENMVTVRSALDLIEAKVRDRPSKPS